jgi:hypothetical protein
MATILKILALLIFIIVSSCTKEKQARIGTGANTVSALVDGKQFEKKACWSCIKAGSALDVFYNDSIFNLSAEDKDQNLVLELEIKSLKAAGKYTLSSKEKNYGMIYNYNTPYTRFSTSNINNGLINITTFDRQHQIIAGTFEFTAEDEKNAKHTLSVTAGKFNITYK